MYDDHQAAAKSDSCPTDVHDSFFFERKRSLDQKWLIKKIKIITIYLKKLGMNAQVLADALRHTILQQKVLFSTWYPHNFQLKSVGCKGHHLATCKNHFKIFLAAKEKTLLAHSKNAMR